MTYIFGFVDVPHGGTGFFGPGDASGGLDARGHLGIHSRCEGWCSLRGQEKQHRRGWKRGATKEEKIGLKGTQSEWGAHQNPQ